SKCSPGTSTNGVIPAACSTPPRRSPPAPEEPTMRVKTLEDVELRGKRVFIRADLNVPQDETGRIVDDTRIRASVPTIEYCLQQGAAVMVTSHLGRPKEGACTHEDSLAPIAERLSELLGRPVPLIE